MNNNVPKIFISYSRTSEDYTDKVVDIARKIRENGVDVILDQWHLDLGMDLYRFMEQSVRDADKVLLFCDERYQRKANSREGGVGAETIIITPEVYGNAMLTKFIPVIMEKDVEGNPYFPTYIRSRLGLDFVDRFDKDFRLLIKNLFGVKEYEEPPIGQPPEWLKSQGKTSKPVFEYTIPTIRNPGKRIPTFEYPDTPIYVFGPRDELNIELVGVALEHYQSYRRLPKTIRNQLQLLCHAIIQLWNETTDGTILRLNGLWSLRLGNKYDVYTDDMMTMISCSLKKDRLQLEFFSIHQMERATPFITYAENHASKNGRIEFESIVDHV